jgi:hypothetical protein
MNTRSLRHIPTIDGHRMACHKRRGIRTEPDHCFEYKNNKRTFQSGVRDRLPAVSHPRPGDDPTTSVARRARCCGLDHRQGLDTITLPVNIRGSGVVFIAEVPAWP